MSSYFKNKTKAEVLSDLKKRDIKFKVPKTYYFRVDEWNENSGLILNKILLFFTSNKFVAIRSSSIEEDKKNASNAGKFFSQLKIPLKKKKYYQQLKVSLKATKNNLIREKLV